MMGIASYHTASSTRRNAKPIPISYLGPIPVASHELASRMCARTFLLHILLHIKILPDVTIT